MTKQTRSEGAVSGVKSSRRYWRRTEESKSWWPWGFAPLIGLGLLFLFGALFMAPRIEAEVREQVSENFDGTGLSASAVLSDGQGVTVEAVAPLEEESLIAAIAKSTQCDTWAGRLTCPTSVNVRRIEPQAAQIAPQAAPASLSRRPHRFTVERTDDAVRLSGEVPTLEEHDRILGVAGQHFDTVSNSLSISNDPATTNYGRAADRALAVASHLTNGQASWSGEVLTVDGVAEAGSLADVREQFGAIGSGALQGEFNVRTLHDREQCNTNFNEIFASASVRFQSGSAAIDTGNDELLARLADLARSCPGNLTIEGHTDSQGDDEMNKALSLARAKAVRDALATLGIDGNRLSATGFGESRPLADNTTAAGRAQNRRIAITIDELN